VERRGWNFSFLHLAVLNGAETATELKAAGLLGSEPPPSSEPSAASLRQLVGLTTKLFLSALMSIELGAPEHVRDRVGDRVDPRGVGVDEQGHPDDDRAEVEGAGEGRGDHRQ
jgi:hypothetical protein